MAYQQSAKAEGEESTISGIEPKVELKHPNSLFKEIEYINYLVH